MTTATGAGKDTQKGACNIALGHVYSILAVFNILATDGTKIPVLMIRNPWGSCFDKCYNGPLNSNDAFWTPSMINQVPFGVNPVTDDTKYGIFIVPADNFPVCFAYYTIGHYLDDQGY